MMLLGTAVAFSMWIYQANATAHQLGAQGMQFTPGWAVGWFFIPIGNLFKPYQVAQETWKASDPAMPLDRPTAWRAIRGSSLIGLWWTAWIISNVLYQISFRVELKSSGRGGAMTGLALAVPADLLAIVAAGFAILWIWQLRDRQARRYRLVCTAPANY